MHRLSKRLTLIAAVLGVLVVAGGVTGALAATGALSSSPSQPAGVATDISPTLTAHYALLRRPVTQADAIPPGPSGRADYGQNTALARRVGDSGYYAIPGTDDSLCLMTPVGGGVCGKDPTQPTILTSGMCSRSQSADTFHFVGLFPDGIGSLAITSADGAVRQTVPVDTNGASADVPKSTSPLTISWGDADGQHTQPLPVPPGRMYCGPDSTPGS